MVRNASTEYIEAIYNLVKQLWQEGASGKRWEPAVHRAVVRMLWKGKGSRTDPDKHRGICLLTIISRIIAKIVDRRMIAYSEELQLTINEQWGFRSRRSTRDEILVVRLLCEMLADFESRVMARIARSEKLLQKTGSRPQQQDIQQNIAEDKELLRCTRLLLHLYDIKKAYPNVARDYAWSILSKVGVSPALNNIIQQLHTDTTYIVRMASQDSETYRLA